MLCLNDVTSHERRNQKRDHIQEYRSSTTEYNNDSENDETNKSQGSS
jgi:ribosomal protein L32